MNSTSAQKHFLITEGWPPRTSKGKVLACLLSQTRVRKDDVGKITLAHGYVEIEWMGRDPEDLKESFGGMTTLEVDGRKVFCWATNCGETHQAWAVELSKGLESSAEFERRALEKAEGIKAKRVEVDWNHLDQCVWTLVGNKGSMPNVDSLRSWQGVRLISGSGEIEGRALEVENNSVKVLLAEEPEEEAGEVWSLFPSFHELAHQRKMRAVLRLPALMERHDKTEWLGNGENLLPRNDLNESQNNALKKALSEGVSLIHGPPGTGKTHLLGAMIATFVAQGKRVLACASSHSAVDHLARTALRHGVQPLRLGQLERVSPDIKPYHLKEKLDSDSEVKLAFGMQKDARKILDSAKSDKKDKGEAKELLAQGRELLRQRRWDLVQGGNLLMSTLAHLAPEIYGDLDVDVVIVDEAGQCQEAEAWQGLSMGKKWVLAGDPQQLPATVKSNHPILKVSLLERWMKEGVACVTLEEQYRMFPVLMNFSSEHFYESRLRASKNDEDIDGEPLLRFIDMSGSGDGEETVGSSMFNKEEAKLLIEEVDRAIREGTSPNEIGVISPYRGQVDFIKKPLEERGVEVNSIDGFQGREKESIFISLVRSNPEGSLGFLKDYRRMNVALTRAKRTLVVLGDSSTLGGDDFYSAWLDYVEAEGEYRSCFEWDSA